MKVTIKELTIESDSDFSHVNIDFSKGSLVASPGVYTEPKNIETEELKPKKQDVFEEAALDLDENFDHVSEEIIEKPVIETEERDVNVSEDMMSAEF